MASTADHHHAGGGADEDVDDAADHDGQRADEQPLAHARQVALDHAGQAGHDEEHAGRAAEGRHDQSGPFLKPSTMAIMRESIRPMKKVKASSTGTPAAEFLVLFDGEHEAERAAQEHDQAQAAAQAAGDARGHAQPGAQHGGQQAQRQQPVGVAQDTCCVALRVLPCVGVVRGACAAMLVAFPNRQMESIP
jgi:hypothetical protein